jgi:glyoxylase-like metal-dependent hydrolase (beta-lactamase superfamily II)
MYATEVMGNSQRLDGGALFGNAPRALWSRWHEPDELNRIPLACRALLIQDGSRNILLEAGIGAFFAPEQRERYGVVESNHVLLDSLAKLGLSHEDVDAVILSHLHFDHAGGLLEAHEPGRAPGLLFPNAHFVVSETAFERARNPHPRDRASFIPHLPELLSNSGRLVLVEDATADVPELGAAFRFHVSHGHTPGMLLTEVHGERERILFCADIIPGRAWVRPTISMGYDRYPELLLDEKSALLRDALQAHTWLYFTHDPSVAMGQVTTDAKGQYTSRDEIAHLDRFPL